MPRSWLTLPFVGRRDAKLLARAIGGDARAFRTLYRELHPGVFAFIDRRVPGRADVEDLTGKVFHRFVERLDNYDAARGSVRGWVLTIARNAVIDHYRTRREIQAPDDEIADAALGPADALERDEDLRALHGAVAGLPATVREMFALRFGDGLRHREIAAVLGISEAAVKQRMSRAIRSLREQTAAASKGVRYAL